MPRPMGSLNTSVNTATRRAKATPPPRPVAEPGWVSSHCAGADRKIGADGRLSGGPRASKHKNCYALKCDCWCHKH